MSHGIESADRLILVGESAWHGLGNVIPREEGVGIREGFRKVVPWTPEFVPLRYVAPDPDACGVKTHWEVKDSKGIVARTPGQPDRYLSTVGSGYAMVDHDSFLRLAEAAERVSPDVKLETVGTMQSGKRVFLLLKVGEYGLGLNGDDRTVQYLALLNSFDGSTSLAVFGTDVRILCQNTESYAMRLADDAKLGIRIAHKGADSMSDRLKQAEEAIAKGRLQLAVMEEENRFLADQPMTVSRVGEFFGRVSSILYPAVSTERPADEKEAEAWDRQRARARTTVNQWLAEYEHERQALVAGTAYSALEAVTHWGDHERPRVREVAWDRLMGRGAAIKKQARELALVGAKS